MIESAVDKNITFRLKGRSYLNVNDLNVMNMVGGSNQSSIPNSNLALRISTLEDQLRRAPVGDAGFSPMNRIFTRRLRLLENRVNNGNFGGNTTNLNRRVRQLEIKLNQLIDRLNANNCSSNPCQNAGTCTNTFNGYTCKCTDKWTGNNCEEDVNECAIFAGTDLGCQNGASCENTRGGYKYVHNFPTNTLR